MQDIKHFIDVVIACLLIASAIGMYCKLKAQPQEEPEQPKPKRRFVQGYYRAA